MPSERNAAAGRMPESGGRASSPAAASRIKVDTQDVAKLKRLLGETQVAAKSLSKSLSDFDGGALKALRSANSEIERMRRMLSGGGSYGRTPSGPSGGLSSGAGASNMHAAQVSGGGSMFEGGGSYTARAAASTSTALMGAGSSGGRNPRVNLGGGTLMEQESRRGGRVGSYLRQPYEPMNTGWPQFTRMQNFAITAGTMAASAFGAAAEGHMDEATDRSYLTSRFALSQAPSVTRGSMQAINKGFTQGLGVSSTGYQDTSVAAGSMLGAGRISATAQRNVGQIGMLNPLGGNTGAAQSALNTFTPQKFYKMRSMGIAMGNPRHMNLQSVFDQFITMYERQAGHQLSNSEIETALDPGYNLGATVAQMFDPDTIQKLVTYWQAKRKGGTGDFGQVMGKAGMRGQDLASSRQMLGRETAYKEAMQDRGFVPGASDAARAKGAIEHKKGDLYDTDLGAAASRAAGTVAIFNSELKVAVTLLQALTGASALRGLLSLLGIGSKAGAGAGARAGLAALGGGALGVGALVGGAGAAGLLWQKKMYSIQDEIAENESKGQDSDWWTQMVKRVRKWGIKERDPMAYDVWKQIFLARDKDAAGDFFREWRTEHPAETGGPSGSGSGPGGPASYETLLSMMSGSGVPARATSTFRKGAKTASSGKTSYHATGEAVDFAGMRPIKPGQKGSQELLAINHWWASNHGSQLSELIYSGPGAINIKNGKRVSGFDAVTTKNHYDHVHVAAKASALGGGGGGGLPVGANAAAGGGSGGRRSGYSPTVSGGGSLSDTTQSSSSPALLASLGGGGLFIRSGNSAAGSAPGGGSGSGAASAPTNVTGTKALGKQMAAARGWSGGHWDALHDLWMRESGWRMNADNPTSSAYGIPQALMKTHFGGTYDQRSDRYTPTAAGRRYMDSASVQIDWGLDYIAQRYGDPSKALGFHKTHKWYERGSWELMRDEIAQLHKGEMVVPAHTADTVRDAISQTSGSRGGGAGSGRRAVPVTLVFKVQRGNDAEMRAAARSFVRYVEEDSDIEMVRGS